MVPCLQPRRALGAGLVIAERDKLAEESGEAGGCGPKQADILIDLATIR